jgi:hypothetical protein
MPHEFGDEVCKLRKALYDLKQASRVWYQIIQDFLTKIEFNRIQWDHDVFIGQGLIIAIYVDDLLISKSSAKLNRMTWLQNQLSHRFKMTDLGEISHYVEMKVDVQSKHEQIVFRQTTYLRKIISKFEFLDYKTALISMQPGLGDTLTKSIKQTDSRTTKWYQSAIEFFIWLVLHTRSDISYSVKVMTRFCSNSFMNHCHLVERIFCYLADTLTLNLIFKRRKNDDLIDYSDFDFANLIETKKSIDDFAFMLTDTVIPHLSKLQDTVVLFTAETEYIILCKIDKKVVWIVRLLNELNYQNDQHTTLKFIAIYENNKDATALTNNSKFHRRTKHIEMRWHWVCEKIAEDKIHLFYFNTKTMMIDELIKSLYAFAHLNFRIMIHLID